MFNYLGPTRKACHKFCQLVWANMKIVNSCAEISIVFVVPPCLNLYQNGHSNMMMSCCTLCHWLCLTKNGSRVRANSVFTFSLNSNLGIMSLESRLSGPYGRSFVSLYTVHRSIECFVWVCVCVCGGGNLVAIGQDYLWRLQTSKISSWLGKQLKKIHMLLCELSTSCGLLCGTIKRIIHGHSWRKGSVRQTEETESGIFKETAQNVWAWLVQRNVWHSDWGLDLSSPVRCGWMKRNQCWWCFALDFRAESNFFPPSFSA